MGDSKNEWELLVPLVPFLLVAPSLKFLAGWESVEAAFLIVVVPLLTFPAILVVGQIYNGNETWKQRYKEGGIFGLGAYHSRSASPSGSSTTTWSAPPTSRRTPWSIRSRG